MLPLSLGPCSTLGTFLKFFSGWSEDHQPGHGHSGVLNALCGAGQGCITRWDFVLIKSLFFIPIFENQSYKVPKNLKKPKIKHLCFVFNWQKEYELPTPLTNYG